MHVFPCRLFYNGEITAPEFWSERVTLYMLPTEDRLNKQFKKWWYKTSRPYRTRDFKLLLVGKRPRKNHNRLEKQNTTPPQCKNGSHTHTPTTTTNIFSLIKVVFWICTSAHRLHHCAHTIFLLLSFSYVKCAVNIHQ